MKEKLVLVFAVVFMALPLAVSAAGHGDHSQHKGMNHGEMDHSKMDHSGMNMQGDMIMLPPTEAGGIAASAYMKDIRAGAALADMGMGIDMDMTHHFMIKFVDQKTGEAIEKGSVALRVVDAEGNKSKPVRLMPMAGQFGADITIGEGMMHTLEVGSKLPDGKKRQFEFMFHQM